MAEGIMGMSGSRRAGADEGPHACIRAPNTALIAIACLLATVCSPARAQDANKKIIGPGSCSSGPCHDIALQWWQSDAHYATAQPFIDQSGKYKTLASVLQISLDDASAVNRRCMNCHGTVLSGAENRLVEEGVSCESCHGPAAAWKDPHQDKMSSYAKLEGAGMIRVDQPATRARVCVDCHYVVDQELLRAGHPYGWGKDDIAKYTGGVERRISDKRHWREKTLAAVDRDPASFLERVTAKGDVPFFPPVEGLPTSGGDRIVYVERDCDEDAGESSIFFPAGAAVDVALPELSITTNPDSLTESLALIQDRIEALYRILAGPP